VAGSACAANSISRILWSVCSLQAPPYRYSGECRGVHFRATTERVRQHWLTIAGRARLGGRYRHHVLSASQIIKGR